VQPSLAVAEALRSRGVQVSFAGPPDRAEAWLAPDAGFEVDPFKISGFPRRPGPSLFRAVAEAAAAPLACRRILERRRPDVVLGGGSYAGGPMAFAAWQRHIPAAVMEADARLGLANRLALPFVRRVFLSFPIGGREGGKYRVVGRPVRRVPVPSAEEARRLFDLPEQGPVLLVFGGSHGSLALNELSVDAFGRAGPAVLHLCGRRYYDRLRPRVERADYRLLPWTDDFAAALAASDLVLARAGGSVWEVAAAGKPAVLVPSPNVTADHQTKNARYFADRGGAILVPETELGRVPELLRSLLGHEHRRRELAEAMLAMARPDAADEIAEELIALARA
jgi:UDP-N-acetylglucosamine--N-acetylmuramyl-(pentapeptide) pyrophosphoryl-undecaprenol N-acetylglucosamine transferase